MGKRECNVCVHLFVEENQQSVLISISGQLTSPAANHPCGHTFGFRTAWALLIPDTFTHMHARTHGHTHTHTQNQSSSREEQRARMSHYCLHRKL